MFRTAVGLLALVLFLPALGAQVESKVKKDEPKAKEDKPATPQEQYQAILKEFQTAQQQFFKEYRDAKTDEERQKAFAKNPKPQDYAKRFMELAEKNPKDPAAIDALVWVATSAGYTPQAGKAIDLLIQDHIQSDKLGPVCQSLVYSQSPQAEKLLRAVVEKNSHHQVQGLACFSLAQYLKNHSERPGGPDSQKQVAEAEKLLEQVVEKYADVKSYRGTLREAAKGVLFEIRNLAIGKPVPDIEGEDIDGKKFKLSDYRGKVVVLDFWGNW
jgi:hypothetical protein